MTKSYQDKTQVSALKKKNKQKLQQNVKNILSLVKLKKYFIISK